jgi:hypothetical protein
LSFFNELKRRNVFKVVIAYMVMAWLVLQVADVILNNITAPDWIFHVMLLFVAIGLPFAIFFAWAFELTSEGIRREHEVDRSQSITPQTGKKLNIMIFAVMALALGYFAYDKFVLDRGWDLLLTASQPAAEAPSQPAPDQQYNIVPLVIMMDSHHADRVYDDDTLASGGTNADVVSDILLDLPINRQKEAVSHEWHRDEDILGFHPDLIIIHYSAFVQESGSAPRKRLRLFIEFFADTDTRFIIYSRAPGAFVQEQMEELLAELDQEHPGLLERIHVYGLRDHGEPRWRDPATAASLKLLVKRVLAIE